jgi:hypothetical protein
VKGIEKNILFSCLIVCILGLIPMQSSAQSWEDQHKDLNDRDIELTVYAGMSSYYGDLSIYDKNYFDKLSHESGFSGGLVLTKRLAPQIGVSGQILAGKINARKGNVSFESTILEYNLHVRLDMLKVFSKYSKTKIKWDVLFGFGNILFNSTKTTLLEGENQVDEHKARVPELVFFGGTGLSYRLNEKIGINAEISIHQFQNDKIDITVNSNDFDYFSLLNFGFTYYFRSFEKTAPRNKARIAHSNKRMKPLKSD